MAKKIPLLALSAIFVSQVAFAESASNWIQVSSSNDGVISVKKGSFRNLKGESSALFMNEKTNKKVEYYKIGIKNADCDNGYGKLSFFGMDGRLNFQGDYVSEGSSVGASLGDFICGVRQAEQSS